MNNLFSAQDVDGRACRLFFGRWKIESLPDLGNNKEKPTEGTVYCHDLQHELKKGS